MNKSQIFKAAHALARAVTKDGDFGYRVNFKNALIVVNATAKNSTAKVADYTITNTASQIVGKPAMYDTLYKKLGMMGCFAMSDADMIARVGGAEKMKNVCKSHVAVWANSAVNGFFRTENVVAAAASIVKSYNAYYG